MGWVAFPPCSAFGSPWKPWAREGLKRGNSKGGGQAREVLVRMLVSLSLSLGVRVRVAANKHHQTPPRTEVE